MRIKTAPLKQWFVGREFRRRVNKALREQGVEMCLAAADDGDQIPGWSRDAVVFWPWDSWTILTPALAPTRVAPAATIAFSPS